MTGALEESSPPVQSNRQKQPALTKAGLATFFFLAQHALWLLRCIRPIAVWLTLWCSRAVARNLRLNAQGIYGRTLSAREQRAFARGVVGNFYTFVVDLAAAGDYSLETITDRIEQVDGEPAYLDARHRGCGAVLVTAHMGAFEVGLAALRRVEPRVHVVFKRDAFAGFERIRQRVREHLGVIESPIDEGLPALFKLRDALEANEVVVMQGDRAMLGQRAQAVPFLHGRLRMPTGPVKLARLTGSPIVPVFVLRGRRGRFRIHLATPIDVNASAEDEAATSAPGAIDPALLAIARTFEAVIGQHPEQWLVLERAFVDDVRE
jgi:KDO2-lipid IV(A) lauroyltransferase